jgi:hypothetical protein
LLQAVREAVIGLSGAGQDATPSAIEGWIKENQYSVWASITTASALKGAIDAVKKEPVARPIHVTGPTPAPMAPPSPPPTPVRQRIRKAATSAPKEANGMARQKKARTHLSPEPPAKAEPAGTGNGSDQDSLAEVVRKALNGLGTEAGSAAVKRWITRNYPGREFDTGALRTTIRNQRARLKKASAPASAKKDSAPASPPPAPRARPHAASGYDPTKSEMLRVLEIARQESSVSRLRKIVQTVKQLADQVGGLDRLAVCLDALEEFGIK